MMLGSSSNGDGDGNENGKKSNRFILAKEQLCTCSTLIGYFTFYEGRERKATIFLLFF